MARPYYPQPQDELTPEEMDAIASMGSPMPGQPPVAPVAPPPPSMPEIVDPWEAIEPPGDAPISESDIAQAFPMDEGNYGRQTVSQLASPEAPAYLPPAPPAAANGKAAFSATDQDNELFGVTAPVRDVDGEMAQLAQARSQPMQSAPATRENEKAYDSYGDSDKRAQIAYVMNWLAGGPEQAQRFQESYDRRKAQDRQGRTEARAKDTAANQASAPITDAQAQTLVRTYRISPEAAAKMTQREYAQLEPVLKSTPYVANQSQAGDQKLSIEQMKLIDRRLSNMEDNAAGLTNTQVRGQNAILAAKANKKTPGEGTGGPRDIRSVLVASYGARPDAEALIDRSIAKMQNGEPAQPGTPEAEIIANYMLLESMPGKKFADAQRDAFKAGATGRTGRDHGTDESIEAKQRDPAKRAQTKIAFDTSWNQVKNAAKAFKRLKAKGKIDMLVQVPYGKWNAVIASMRDGEDQADARAISAFINPTMRAQTGAALSEFEKDMAFTQFGVSADANPFNSSDAMESWLRSAGDDMVRTSKTIEAAYPGLMTGGK
jgi:hypothetical protein